MDIISPKYNSHFCKSPVLSIPIDNQFAPFIGHNIILWSRIDEMLNTFIQVLSKYTGEGKNHKYLDKRLENFEHMVDLLFDQHIELKKELITLSNDIKRYVIDRNLLAHGALSMVSGEKAHIKVVGTINKKEVTHTYNRSEMEFLFYEISHIGGRLFSFIYPMTIREEDAWPAIPLQSIKYLRELFEGGD